MSAHTIDELGQGHNINKGEVHEKEDDQMNHKKAMEMSKGLVVPMVLKSAIELNILDIIFDAGSFLSSSEVAGRIQGCVNPNAPALLNRVLSLLASLSILECKLRSEATNEEPKPGKVERLYGVGPLCKYFLANKKLGLEYSFSPRFLVRHDKLLFDMWDNLNDAILEGGIPFNNVHGMPYYEFTKKDLRLNKLFNESMANTSTYITKNILDIYHGFEGINVLVDVGGGNGITLNLVISKYPNIKGIIFDLPHVLPDNPKIAHGVETVEGDMFEGIPNGDAIMLKWILHNWSDEQCLILLKNCWKALPENGKVIIVEALLPSTLDVESQCAHELNMQMFAMFGAKERTEEEYETLAFQSGFSSCHAVCCVDDMWVMELHKAC